MKWSAFKDWWINALLWQSQILMSSAVLKNVTGKSICKSEKWCLGISSLWEELSPFLVVFCSVQSLSDVQLFATPWTAARQASLSITNSWSLLKFMSIESVVPSTISSSLALFSFCLQSFPSSGSFPMSQFFTSGGQGIGVSASASVLPMNIQDWSPLGWTGWISLQSKGLSKVLSNTTVQKHQFFGAQLSSRSNSHIHTWPLEKP